MTPFLTLLKSSAPSGILGLNRLDCHSTKRWTLTLLSMELYSQDNINLAQSASLVNLVFVLKLKFIGELSNKRQFLF